MKRWLAGLIVLLSPPAFAQSPPEIPYDSVPESLEAAARHASRRGRGRRGQLQGPHLRLFARRLESGPGLRQHRLAAPGVRPQRQVPARDRQEPLRLGLRAHGADRQGRQHLGHRQGLGHGHQVQPGRPGRDGVRPQVGSLRRRGACRTSATRTRRCRTSTAASASRPTSTWDPNGEHLHQRRLRQFARRQDQQGRRLGQVVGRARQGPGPVQPACTPSRPTRRATSTSATATTAASRCSTATATSCASSRSTCRSTADAKPAIGNKPDLTNYLQTGGSFAPGAPWAICITPGPNQVLYASDAYPGPHLQAQPRRQGARLSRQVGQAAQAVRLDSRDRLPVRERALRRRDPQLAGAEADAASGAAARRPAVTLAAPRLRHTLCSSLPPRSGGRGRGWGDARIGATRYPRANPGASLADPPHRFAGEGKPAAQLRSNRAQAIFA